MMATVPTIGDDEYGDENPMRTAMPTMQLQAADTDDDHNGSDDGGGGCPADS
jgi:hypothetical protein